MRRASGSKPAPMRCATSVLLALASDKGIMNMIETMFTAIWWPATGVAPRREMKKAMKVKPVTSMPIAKPIGTPRRSRPARLSRCGASMCLACSPKAR